jgi:protein-S-isoprenylcysteine O-methyltransferase Ste14
MTKLLDRVFVWAGGALFVAALVLTVWTFALVWAVPRPWGGWTAVAIDAAMFTLFAAHHSLFARTRAKAVVSKVVPHPLLRSVYVWIASALLIAVCVLWMPIGGALYDVRQAWLRIVLGIAQLTGVWLIARSVGAIDALELAGIRQASAVQAGESLQVNGPYRIVRHPLYLGWLLIVFGPARMTGDRFVFAAITTFYLVIAIPWEEQSLLETFGDAYARYKQHVRWKIVPYLY